MELLNHITNLIGLKDKNIDIKSILQHQEYIEIRAKLDYQSNPCPHCQGKIIKYNFQKASTIPLLAMQGMPTVLKHKKRRFQCKECRRCEALSILNIILGHLVDQIAQMQTEPLIFAKAKRSELLHHLALL